MSAKGQPKKSSNNSRAVFAAVAVGVVALGVIAIIAAGGGSDDADDATTVESPAPPSGVEVLEVQGGHVDGAVEYPHTPPAGGPHTRGAWQNCGFYSEPVQNEIAVHSLEHGAVWVTYAPDLPAGAVATLRDLVENDDRGMVLVSPFPGLPSPVVATAWGRQLPLDSPDDPRLVQFVDAFVRGAQAPEPQGPCEGGVGQPDA
ncbi:MAG TPA: DUF3105 domain-containing protein [Acidimicrobiia bacterium]|nr:DUF3105 domain-containing protein [Acidimicrobiia bacterium]